MSMLPVYVYGNGDLYAEYFNSIVRSFGESTFTTLIHISLLLAGFTVVFSLVLRRDLMIIVRWLGLFYLSIYVLFTPKTTVEVIDLINNNKPYAIDHVPLGLGLLANLTTTLSYALTELTEMNFTMPDDIRYHKSGMVFASQIVRAASQFEITDARFDQNLQDFIHQCVFYDILLKKYSINDLLQSDNIWSLVSQNASPARAFIYTNEDNYSEVTVCREGVSYLTTDWKKAIDTVETQYASRMFHDAVDPKETLKKYLDISYGYLTGISSQATAIMQQNLMANAIQRGVLRMGAVVDASAALQSYAFVRSQEQKRLTNQTVGDMAAYWLPLIKNDLELIMYGSFIFIILLLVFPFGVRILQSYIYTLVWIALWAPLYAVLNLAISFYAKQDSYAVVSGVLSLQAMPGLLQVNSDISGLAGYMSMSVPALAGGLLWGMQNAFSQVSQYVGGVLQSAAGTGATEAVTGNIGFGNTNFQNHSAFNTSANHLDTSLRTSTGASNFQLIDGSQLSIMPNGNEVINMQNTVSNVGASIGWSNAYRTSYGENAERSYAAVKQDSIGISDATSSAMRNIYDYAEHLNHSTGSGESWNKSESSGTAKAFGNVKRITEDLADRFHISYSDAANLAASIYAEGKGGVSGHFGYSNAGGYSNMKGGIDGSLSGSLGVSRIATHTSSTDQGNLYSKAKDFLEEKHFSDNVDYISRVVKDNQFRTNDEEGKRFTDNVSSSFDRAENYRKDMASNLQSADNYRQMASYFEENSVHIDDNLTNEFVDWLAKQPNRDGTGKLGIDSVPAIMHDPEYKNKYLQKFANEYKTQFEHDWNHGLSHSKHAIEQTYQNNNRQINSSNTISQFNQTNEKSIRKKSHSEGLSKNHLVNESAKQDTEKNLLADKSNVDTGLNEVDNKGQVVTQKVESEKNIQRHGNLIHDFIHDIDTSNHG